MFTPAFINNGLPSWETGRDNDIQPYRLVLMREDVNSFWVEDRDGHRYELEYEDFLNGMASATQSFVLGRLSFREWTVKIDLSPFTSPPIGGPGDVYFDDGRFVVDLGERTLFNLSTGWWAFQQAYLRHRGFLPAISNCAIAIGRDDELEENHLISTQEVILRMNILAVRGRVKELRLMKDNQPFTGSISLHHNVVSDWRDGKWIRERNGSGGEGGAITVWMLMDDGRIITHPL